MKEAEVWVVVDGFPDYLVSNFGRVKSIGRTTVRRDGITSRKKELIKKQCKTRGHLVTRLWRNGTSKCLYVHRLMAKAFIPNPENKPHINHKDGNKNNNSLSNLEWCTPSENNQHAIDNGLRGYNKGCDHAFSVFSKEEVLNIRKLFKSGLRIADITRLYNKDRNSINRIAKGLSYQNVLNG